MEGSSQPDHRDQPGNGKALTNGQPVEGVVAEAERVLERAAKAEVTVRLVGGVAVALRCASARRDPLRRTYADIDLAARSRDREAIKRLMIESGYQADEAFNALHGRRRLYFWDPYHSRQLDVFLDEFEMCHRLRLTDRIPLNPVTLPMADLLLMKLQIVETNAKDLQDIIAILTDHEFTEDDNGLNLRYICELTGGDWGLWKTTTTVAQRALKFSATLEGLTSGNHLHAQVERFIAALQEAPKSRAWRLRARIGEKKRWYELPEEAH